MGIKSIKELSQELLETAQSMVGRPVEYGRLMAAFHVLKGENEAAVQEMIGVEMIGVEGQDIKIPAWITSRV